MRLAWTSTDPAKEEPIADANVVIGSGYSESKWVAERIMQVAAEKTAFKPIVVRIGQLSGAANGSWNRSEWLPCIVKSGEVMGVLPDGEEVMSSFQTSLLELCSYSLRMQGISWLPLQNAASAVIEFRHAPAHIQLMHLTHPRPVKWSTVFPHFSNAIGAKLIPYGDWLARLEASAQAPGVTEVEAARQNPALLLLDSFRAYDSGVAADIFAGRDAMGVVKMDSTHAVRVAPALSEMHLEPLGKKDVESWVNYWRETGFLAQQGLKRKSEEPEDGPPAKKVATLQLA